MKQIVIASANGNRCKNGGAQTCVERAYEGITRGEDVLDALIAGATINELDPADDSVGFGGLPNADGVVQLDAACMHGPKGWAGGVAVLEGVRTPSLVAKAVMEQTDHHLLAGSGAQEFARRLGFTIEADLNSEHSREKWYEWKRRTDSEHYLDPANRQWGTLHCGGLNAKGDLCAVTTTSGLAWKIPGRVADSTVIGAGLYVDNALGAAGSTGRGEANLYGLSSFYIIEQIAAGCAPKDAVIDALRRVKERTKERRLLNGKGNPRFTLTFYALNKAGVFAAASMYAGNAFAVCDENGPRTLDAEGLLEGNPFD